MENNSKQWKRLERHLRFITCSAFLKPERFSYDEWGKE